MALEKFYNGKFRWFNGWWLLANISPGENTLSNWSLSSVHIHRLLYEAKKSNWRIDIHFIDVHNDPLSLSLPHTFVPDKKVGNAPRPKADIHIELLLTASYQT